MAPGGSNPRFRNANEPDKRPYELESLVFVANNSHLQFRFRNERNGALSEVG